MKGWSRLSTMTRAPVPSTCRRSDDRDIPFCRHAWAMCGSGYRPRSASRSWCWRPRATRRAKSSLAACPPIQGPMSTRPGAAIEFGDGARMAYDPQTHGLTITLPAGGTAAIVGRWRPVADGAAVRRRTRRHHRQADRQRRCRGRRQEPEGAYSRQGSAGPGRIGKPV